MTVQTITVKSPVTGEVVGEVVDGDTARIDEAMLSARSAVAEMERMSVWERCDLLQATADALEDIRAGAVDGHVAEHGKTIGDADAEIAAAVAGLRLTAESARQLSGEVVGVSDRQMKVLVERRALGIVAAITPWNVPFMTAVEYGAPALAMGNPFVLKPAESVPFAASCLERAFDHAGWPPGAVTVLRGGPLTGEMLAQRPELAGLCFTGSTEVGLQLAARGGMRRFIAELGGNGPTIVFPDADIDHAADAVVRATLFLSGQSCAATERVLVHEDVHQAFVEAVADRIRAEVLGDPRNPPTTLGPLHLSAGVAKVRRHLADAETKGARVIRRPPSDTVFRTENYVDLAVLDGVDPGMAVFREETFGPVIPVTGFTNADQAVALANSTRYGLSSAVFTADLDRAFDVSARLASSHVVINRQSTYWEMHLPWGGGPGTESGVGRLGGRHALIELSGTKTTAIALTAQSERRRTNNG